MAETKDVAEDVVDDSAEVSVSEQLIQQRKISNDVG
jgi:hypothetical protein